MKNQSAKLLSMMFILMTLWWLVEVSAQAAPPPQDSRNCDSTVQEGVGFYEQAKYDGALRRFRTALICYQLTGNQVEAGVTLNKIGTVYYDQGRYDEALATYQQALNLAAERDDWADESLLGLVVSHLALGQDDQARLAAQNLLDYYPDSEYAETVSQLIEQLAVGASPTQAPPPIQSSNACDALREKGYAQVQDGRALLNYRSALVCYHQLGDQMGQGDMLDRIGIVYNNQGRYDIALKAFEQALIIRREVGDRVGEGTTLEWIGYVQTTQGHTAEALRAYEQVLSIRRELKDRLGEADTLDSIGMIYQNQGRYDEALESYRQTLDLLLN